MPPQKIRYASLGHVTKERAKNAAKNRRRALEIAMRLEEAERGNTTKAHLRKLLVDVSERMAQPRAEVVLPRFGGLGVGNGVS